MDQASFVMRWSTTHDNYCVSDGAPDLPIERKTFQELDNS